MRKRFSIRLLGYRKREVKNYISDVKREYESDLTRQKDRMLELIEENRRIKDELRAKNKKIASMVEQERYISKVLVIAEEKAQGIIEDGKKKSIKEFYKLKEDKEKWYEKFRQVRTDLLNFERTLVELLDRFRDDINYYASKEISEVILLDEEEQKEKKVIA